MSLAPTALALLLACALFVHLRGRERLTFRRQLTDHSTFMAPCNALMHLFSAVPRGPILDARDFPELAPLRDNWQVLRDEALLLHERGEIRPAEKNDDVAFNSFIKRGWTRVVFDETFIHRTVDDTDVHALGQARRRFKREHRLSYRGLRLGLVAILVWLVLSPLR